MYTVQIQDASPSTLRLDKTLFHGVNKSGSGALATTLREGYFNAGRANEFISTYHAFPRDTPTFRRMLETIVGPFFAVDHYLYRSPVRVSNPAWISLIRHPIPRIVSCHNWMKRGHIARHQTAEGFPSLDEFILSTRGKKHTQLSQFALGFSEDSKSNLPKISPNSLYEMAIENIERDFRFVAIAEYFEESIYILSARLGLPKVPLWKKDIRNTGRTDYRELPAATIQLAHDVLEAELRLYAEMKKRFIRGLDDIQFLGDFARYKLDCLPLYRDRIL